MHERGQKDDAGVINDPSTWDVPPKTTFKTSKADDKEGRVPQQTTFFGGGGVALRNWWSASGVSPAADDDKGVGPAARLCR